MYANYRQFGRLYVLIRSVSYQAEVIEATGSAYGSHFRKMRG